MEDEALLGSEGGGLVHFEAEYSTRRRPKTTQPGKVTRRRSSWMWPKAEEDEETNNNRLSRSDSAWAVNSAGVPVPGLNPATSLGTFRGVFVPACTC